MTPRPPLYARFADNKLILRDELAIERTLLANERTLLAYLRSGVALIIAGVTMIHFSEQGWFLVVGVFCLPAGIACAIIGVVRFRRVNRSMVSIRERRGEPLPSASPGAASPVPSGQAPGLCASLNKTFIETFKSVINFIIFYHIPATSILQLRHAASI